MLPKYHLILGIFFVTIFYFIFHTNIFYLLIILLSSVLIDVDHLFYFFIIKKDCNPFHAYNWYTERWKKSKKLSREQLKKTYIGFYMFHGIEILAVLYLLGIYFPIFFFIFIGFAFHMIVDIPDEIIKKGTIEKSSLIYNYYRFRKLNSR
ncbi:Uncharacterised protein [uncultured archaeon]|nr:Uncharacterised protein [uncultured archaeon]